MNTTKLSKFTDTVELHNIGQLRLAKLLATFEPQIASAGIPVPVPPDENNPPVNGQYFDAVAELLRRHDLPEPFTRTLAAIELGASTENATALDLVIQRRLPCISLKRDCPLDCALELFFVCFDELV